jgi:hypothetical protein
MKQTTLFALHHRCDAGRVFGCQCGPGGGASERTVTARVTPGGRRWGHHDATEWASSGRLVRRRVRPTVASRRQPEPHRRPIGAIQPGLGTTNPRRSESEPSDSESVCGGTGVLLLAWGLPA